MTGAGDDLGVVLRGHRRRAGLSQGDLAERAGVSVRGLRDIEKGRVLRPRDGSVRRLLGALPLSDPERAALLGRLEVGPPDGVAGFEGGAEVEIGVLGPLLLRRRATRLTVDQAMPRTLLSLLALQPGETVSTAAAIDVLWGDEPPRTYRNLIQVYIGRLRRLLDIDRPARPLIHRVPVGYLLDPAAASVDVVRFDGLFDQAVRSQARGGAEAAAFYRDALRCWRGPVLADADHRLRQHPAVVRLGRRRIEAAVALADLAPPEPRPGELLAELRELAAVEPLHEGLYARLIGALAAAGEQAAAVHTFLDLRERLASQLGVLPGPEVSNAYLRVLRGPAEARAVLRPVDADVVAVDVPVFVGRAPAQLPADLDRFSGRLAALARLDGVLAADRPASAVVITAVSGTAGVGKTALAVRWAHQVRHRFPDGQFYVNLRGFHPTGAALTAGEALHGFLTALGLPPARVPSTVDEQAALFRTLLADRRMLVVLDNARDADQVRPLLPGAPGCLVLITSRNALSSLITADAAQPVPLDLLTPDEARDLLAQRLGAARTAAEPDAVDTIVDRCARLPLALAIAAAHAAIRPDAPLAGLAADLSERRGRLDALTTGEAGTDVRAVFSWSYRLLGPAAARLFRLLGLHPGADISAAAAASLTGLDPAEVTPLLAELTGAQLLTEPRPDRYVLHDLLQAYAADLAGEEDPDPGRRAALTRLFDHYLDTAGAAARMLFPNGQSHQAGPAHAEPPAPVVAIADPGAAREWLDTERANLVAATGHAAAHGWPGHTMALATTLFRYLDSGYFNDSLVLQSRARQAAHDCGDHTAEARAVIHLGIVHRRSGRYQLAEEHHQEALTLFRRIGDRSGEARALSQLGIVAWRLGRYPQSEQLHQASLDLFREIGDRLGEATQLNYFGVGNRQNGHIRASIEYHEQALALFRQLDHRFGEADALDCLGTTYQELGQHQPAIECHQQAMATFQAMGHRPGEVCAMNNLGQALLRSGHPVAACEQHQRALVLCREIGERSFEIESTNGLGAALLAAGDPATARARYGDALSLAERIGDRHEQAAAHRGLADTYHATGDVVRARHHWQQARTIYAELGLPDAEHLANQLQALDR
jgi:DNA-binding SARP family transcriptional activator/tetratricopeptide (TPR) repeat protein